MPSACEATPLAAHSEVMSLSFGLCPWKTVYDGETEKTLGLISLKNVQIAVPLNLLHPDSLEDSWRQNPSVLENVLMHQAKHANVQD